MQPVRGFFARTLAGQVAYKVADRAFTPRRRGDRHAGLVGDPRRVRAVTRRSSQRRRPSTRPFVSAAGLLKGSVNVTERQDGYQETGAAAQLRRKRLDLRLQTEVDCGRADDLQAV